MQLNEILCGHVLDILRKFPDESFDCCVTSPPYWGLRDYKGALTIWDLDLEQDCNHNWEMVHPAGYRSSDTKPGAIQSEGTKNRENLRSDVCSLCGAWRGSLGLEPTPELYVQHLTEVFREVRRTLKPQGTLWLNLGDSYASQGGPEVVQSINPNRDGGSDSMSAGKSRTVPVGLKPKDLVGIPWRVAFALQADGWYLRSDIIWSKPNPMPESVRDRPTKAHEYLFLLSKSPNYYYDNYSIREAYSSVQNGAAATFQRTNSKRQEPMLGQAYETHRPNREDHVYEHGGRNKRSVWIVNTQPYKDAHFATFPEKLVEPCILAGTSEKGVCTKCGAPWERIVEKGPKAPEPSGRHPTKRLEPHQAGNVGQGNMGFRDSRLSGQEIGAWKLTHPDLTSGWQPTCECVIVETHPCAVLDPFVGSGTTCLVAAKLNRAWVGIDLNPEYVKMAQERVSPYRTKLDSLIS